MRDCRGCREKKKKKRFVKVYTDLFALYCKLKIIKNFLCPQIRTTWLKRLLKLKIMNNFLFPQMRVRMARSNRDEASTSKIELSSTVHAWNASCWFFSINSLSVTWMMMTSFVIRESGTNMEYKIYLCWDSTGRQVAIEGFMIYVAGSWVRYRI